MKSITCTGFKGMRNLNPSAAEFRDDTKKLIPRLVVNADVDDIGVATKRDGFSKLLNLPGAHSLWAGSVMLAIANGSACQKSLYKIEDGGATELCEVTGPLSRMYYAERGDRVLYLQRILASLLLHYQKQGLTMGSYSARTAAIPHGWGQFTTRKISLVLYTLFRERV